MSEITNQSSFIPKQGATKKKQRRASTSILPLPIISSGILYAALIASGFVFFYQGYINRNFEQAVADLDQASASFNESNMQRVVDFDQRLRLGQKLVSEHVAVTEALRQLEASTVQTAQFKSLTYEKDVNESGLKTLTLSGELIASSVDAVLFQSSPYITELKPASGPQFFDVSFETPEGENASMGREVAYELVVTLEPANIAYSPVTTNSFTIDSSFDQDIFFEPELDFGDLTDDSLPVIDEDVDNDNEF